MTCTDVVTGAEVPSASELLGVASNEPPVQDATGDPTLVAPGGMREFVRQLMESEGLTAEDYLIVEEKYGAVATRRRDHEPHPACWDLLTVLRPVLARLESGTPATGGRQAAREPGCLDSDSRRVVLDLLRAVVIREGGGRVGLRELHRAMAEIDWHAVEYGQLRRDGRPDRGMLAPETPYGWLGDAYYLLWRDMLLEVLESIRSGRLSGYLPLLLVEAVREALNPTAEQWHETEPREHPLPPPRAREGLGPIQRTGPPAPTWANLPQVLPTAA